MMKTTYLKTTIAATLIIGLMTSAGAVLASSLHKKPDFEYWAYKLELSDSQRDEFIRVMDAQGEKRRALREEARQQRKEQMEAHRLDTLSALSDVLTNEQLLEFESMIEKRKQKIMEIKRKSDK